MKVIRPAAVAGMLLLLPFAGIADSLILAGSDLLPAAVQDALVEEAGRQELDLQLAFEGSLKGLEALASGEVSAALLAVGGSSDKPQDLRSYPFVYQIAALVVHADNPVTTLTYDQLSSILRKNPPFQEWGDLVDEQEWRDRKIEPVVLRTENSLSVELINAYILKREALADTLRYLDVPDEEFRKTLVDDPGMMGIAPWTTDQPGVRRLAVAEDQGGQGYSPSPDNVFFGDYPLRLPFELLVGPSLEREVLGKLLAVLYSDEVEATLGEANLIPVPEQEQRAILFPFKVP